MEDRADTDDTDDNELGMILQSNAEEARSTHRVWWASTTATPRTPPPMSAQSKLTDATMIMESWAPFFFKMDAWLRLLLRNDRWSALEIMVVVL